MKKKGTGVEGRFEMSSPAQDAIATGNVENRRKRTGAAEIDRDSYGPDMNKAEDEHGGMVEEEEDRGRGRKRGMMERD